MVDRMYQTDRFYVRPLNEQDLAGNYRSWFHDQEVTKHNSHGLFPYTKTAMKQFFEQLESGPNIVWAVMIPRDSLLKKDDCQTGYCRDGMGDIHIGNVTLQSINWINRSAEFACVFGEKEYWGKGYGTEAAALIYDHGFKKLNLHRIWTGTADTNEGMKGIARKLGMIEEGRFRNGTFLNGKYEDVVAYGILDFEWEGVLKRIMREPR